MEQLGKYRSVLSPFNLSPGTHKLSDTFLRTSKICRSFDEKFARRSSLFFFQWNFGVSLNFISLAVNNQERISGNIKSAAYRIIKILVTRQFLKIRKKQKLFKKIRALINFSKSVRRSNWNIASHLTQWPVSYF